MKNHCRFVLPFCPNYTIEWWLSRPCMIRQLIWQMAVICATFHCHMAIDMTVIKFSTFRLSVKLGCDRITSPSNFWKRLVLTVFDNSLLEMTDWWYVSFTSCQMKRPFRLILRSVWGESSRMRWQVESFLNCRATMPTPTSAMENVKISLFLCVF